MHEILISIVSTNQNKLVDNLCKNLFINQVKYKIIITLNGKNENLGLLSKYKNKLDICFIKNKEVMGFAKNHNNAFKKYKSNYFLILNPDLRFNNFNLENLKKSFKENGNIKLIAPKIKDHKVYNFDNYRKFPHLLTPFIRKFFKINFSDYFLVKKINYVDWVSGMFMMIDSCFFRKIGYLDENYYLYYEDVDLCRKIKNLNKKVAVIKSCQNKIVHFSRRDSHKKIKYLLYHIKSYIYYHLKFKTV